MLVTSLIVLIKICLGSDRIFDELIPYIGNYVGNDLINPDQEFIDNNLFSKDDNQLINSPDDLKNIEYGLNDGNPLFTTNLKFSDDIDFIEPEDLGSYFSYEFLKPDLILNDKVESLELDSKAQKTLVLDFKQIKIDQNSEFKPQCIFVINIKDKTSHQIENRLFKLITTLFPLIYFKFWCLKNNSYLLCVFDKTLKYFDIKKLSKIQTFAPNYNIIAVIPLKKKVLT
ncbi:hypothetical protein GVAV_000132 [Gurleya vavrai]